MLNLFPFGESFGATMGGQVPGPDKTLFDLDRPHLLNELALKCQLLPGDHHSSLRGGPATLEAHRKGLKLVLTELTRFQPDTCSLAMNGELRSWHNGALHEERRFTSGNLASLPPEWAGRRMQEDLDLMDTGPGTRPGGGELCFANGWDLDDRLGPCFAEIHTRTPLSTTPSVATGERLMETPKSGRTVWRSSWNFMLTDAFDLTTCHKAADKADLTQRAPAQTVGPEVCVRVERQTFTRLPRSGLTLFGAHTCNSPLGTRAADPERARRRLAVWRQTPDDAETSRAIAFTEQPMPADLKSRVLQ